jgi:hypothetical protein
MKNTVTVFRKLMINLSFEIFCVFNKEELLRSFTFIVSVGFRTSAHRHPGLRKEYIHLMGYSF